MAGQGRLPRQRDKRAGDAPIGVLRDAAQQWHRRPDRLAEQKGRRSPDLRLCHSAPWPPIATPDGKTRSPRHQGIGVHPIGESSPIAWARQALARGGQTRRRSVHQDQHNVRPAHLRAGEICSLCIHRSRPLGHAFSTRPAEELDHCVGGRWSGAVHATSALRAGSLAPPSQASKWPAPLTSIMIFGSRAAA